MSEQTDPSKIDPETQVVSTEQLMVAVQYSLIAAASEVLGKDKTLVNKYFTIEAAMKDESVFIIVSEIASKEGYHVPIPVELVLGETDDTYYFQLKELAKQAAPFIPEKNPIKDNWPLPQWKDPEELKWKNKKEKKNEK